MRKDPSTPQSEESEPQKAEGAFTVDPAVSLEDHMVLLEYHMRLREIAQKVADIIADTGHLNVALPRGYTAVNYTSSDLPRGGYKNGLFFADKARFACPDNDLAMTTGGDLLETFCRDIQDGLVGEVNRFIHEAAERARQRLKFLAESEDALKSSDRRE